MWRDQLRIALWLLGFADAHITRNFSSLPISVIRNASVRKDDADPRISYPFSLTGLHRVAV